MRVIKTTTEDGVIFSGLLFEPEQATKKIIINIHGMAGEPYGNAYLQPMFRGYPAAGIAFLSVEQRGTHTLSQFLMADGKVRTIGNAFERFEDCVHDIAAWISQAHTLGYKDIWLQGHSLGCSKVAYAVAQKTDLGIAGLLLISPSDMVGLVHDPEGDAYRQILEPEAKELIAQGKPDQLLSQRLWGEYILSAGTYVNLFGDGARDAIFNYGKPELGFELIRSLSVPVWVCTGTADDGVIPVSDPHAAMKLLEEQLVQSPRKQTVVFEGAKHSFDGFGEQIVQKIVSFISN